MLFYKSHRNYLLVLFVMSVFIFLSAGYDDKLSFTPTPYKLAYNTTSLAEPKIPADNPLTVEGVELGRFLFYDSSLSKNNTISCSSCHKQEFYFTDGGNKVSKGIHGKLGKRNAMSLLNLAWQDRFFWDGRASTLEELALIPIQDSTEMDEDLDGLIRKLRTHKQYPRLFSTAFGNGPIKKENVAKAIAQFLRTITSNGIAVPDSISSHDKSVYMNKGLNESFTSLAYTCGKCHKDVIYSGGFQDNEIDDTEHKGPGLYKYTMEEKDKAKFKVPSLMNVASTAPYMHDGRFSTLREVLSHYNTHLKDIRQVNPNLFDDPRAKMNFNEEDINNFITILSLFKDTSVKSAPHLSNPFAAPNFDWKNY